VYRPDPRRRPRPHRPDGIGRHQHQRRQLASTVVSNTETEEKTMVWFGEILFPIFL
jgi:hypothetical protein